jgi:uncharacterized GH25 family protein
LTFLTVSRILAVLAATIPVVAEAHKAWLLPSQTVVSGHSTTVLVDAAISNDLFHFTYYPLPLDTLELTGPEGAAVQPLGVQTSSLRSSFELRLDRPGTYQATVAAEFLVATYIEAGEEKFWRGPPAAFAKAVPGNARNLEVEHLQRRIETFITAGSPTALRKPSGSGVELVADTHPNDLYAGDRATFRFLFDGKPAAGADVYLLPGGTRYRDGQAETQLRADQDGRVTIVWPAAGLYWLEASLSTDASPYREASKRTAVYMATLEVLSH